MKKILFFISLAVMIAISQNVSSQILQPVPIGPGMNFTFSNQTSDKTFGGTFELFNTQGMKVWSKIMSLYPRQQYTEKVKLGAGSYRLVAIEWNGSGFVSKEKPINISASTNYTTVAVTYTSTGIVFGGTGGPIIW